jgi:uncharacterized protein DUF1552
MLSFKVLLSGTSNMAGRYATRRLFLKAAGVTLALPLLESSGFGAAAAAETPRRMVALCFALGLHGPNVIPQESGADYAATPYLDALGKELRNQLTIVSGTSHLDVTLGHASDAVFLTSARFPGSSTFRNSISLDQLMVEKMQPDTRFPSLVLSTRGGSLSVTRSGVQIPSDARPSTVFTRLFINGSASQVAQQVRRLEDGRSIMDAVLIPARQLQARVSAPDRERLDQYFSAVREVEQRLVSGQEWATKPKPPVDYQLPRGVADPNDDVGRLKLMLDLVQLALRTDSSRFITLCVTGSNAIQPIPGISMEYHGLSHHGQDPEKLNQLGILQTRQMEAVGAFLARLQATKETDQSLLDRTMVLLGAAMGNASSHNCKNLPIILAGGGFRHGQHIAFDQENNTPLCRLYVSMLHRLGIEIDQFGSGKGSLPQFDLKE